MTNHTETVADVEANRDPLTGEPGSHPIGTGAGSIGGAAAGAAVGGAIGGPVGAVIGGTIGAVAGAAAGHAAGEELDPTLEASYWRENFHHRPYYRVGTDFSDYEPAYRYGWENAAHPSNLDRAFEAAEPELERTWRARNPGKPWSQAREASRDAWELTRARRNQRSGS